MHEPEVDASGTKYWRVNGDLHRDGGLPAIENTNRYKIWYFEGHRISQAQSEWIAAIQAREDTRRKWFILARMAQFNCDPKRGHVRRRLERDVREFQAVLLSKQDS